jgi:hypothetical protein
MSYIQKLDKRDKELARKQMIAMLKDSLRDELIALKAQKQIIEEIEALDR